NLLAPHPRMLSISRPESGELVNFGLGMTLATVANYVARNADLYIVVRLLGPTAMGLYLRANILGASATRYFSWGLAIVLFPLYSRVQDEPERLQRWLLLANTFVSLLTIPVMLLLFITAPEVLRGVYGPAWVEATVPLRILALAGIARSFYTVLDGLVKAKGRVYSLFFRHLAFAVLVTSGALLGVRYGIAGVAVGSAVAVSAMFLLMAGLSLELTGTSPTEFLATLRPGLVVGVFTALSAWIVAEALRAWNFPDLAVLGGAVAAGILVAMTSFRRLPPVWLAGLPAVLRDHAGRFVPRPLLRWLVAPFVAPSLDQQSAE
ncbi:MAG: oligosaccharide flippase family protein, partial [Terriglobales bacterium]